jgi:hypothetical protein
MVGLRILFGMARHGSVCLLLGGLAWGQTVSSALTAQKGESQQSETANIASDVTVITIEGLCDNPPAEKAVASNCKTVITRAEFEKVISAVQPDMSARARREFAERYVTALVMAKKAGEMGLDKGVNFEEQMKVARIQVLSQEVNKAFQREASRISDQDIDDYYHDNTSSFEQAEMDRIYIPKAQDPPAVPGKTLSDAHEREQLQRAEPLMRDVADQLHARAIAGEDFNKLQADAYTIAGIKSAASPSLGKIRRISLPPSHVWVMDPEPGRVSAVIADVNGYFIYKVKSKETLPLEGAREEIKGILRSQRIQAETRAIQESATPTLNEVYFHSQRPPEGMPRPTGEQAKSASRP